MKSSICFFYIRDGWINWVNDPRDLVEFFLIYSKRLNLLPRWLMSDSLDSSSSRFFTMECKSTPLSLCLNLSVKVLSISTLDLFLKNDFYNFDLPFLFCPRMSCNLEKIICLFFSRWISRCFSSCFFSFIWLNMSTSLNSFRSLSSSGTDLLSRIKFFRTSFLFYIRWFFDVSMALVTVAAIVASSLLINLL